MNKKMVTTDEVFNALSQFFTLPDNCVVTAFEINGMSVGVVMYRIQCFNTLTNTLLEFEDYLTKDCSNL